MANTKDVLQQLEASLRAAVDASPIIGHFGSVVVEGQNRSWWSIRYDAAVTKLMSNPEYKVAQILSVLGNEVRLAILRHLLERPKSASELVTELGLTTTGQAYHHLRELERARYVRQIPGGKYSFDLDRGRVYLTALALAADAGAEEPHSGQTA